MSKSEIQSWVSSASTSVENGGPLDSFSWHRDRVLNEWPQAVEFAQKRLLASETKVRVQFLREELVSLAKHGDLNLSQTLDIFQLLTRTYPLFVDLPSREAVEAVGMELVRRDELRGNAEGVIDENKLGVTEQILGWLANEVTVLLKRGSSSSYAPSDLFVLLSWSCALYTTCLQANPDFDSVNAWPILVRSIALLFDLLYGSSTIKPSMRRGALMRTRRALRSNGGKVSTLISTLLVEAKSSQTPLKLLPLLGVAIDVLIRLKTVKEDPSTRLSPDIKNEIISLYTSAVLMSKTSVPSHASTALHDFIRTFVSEDDLTNSLLPTMDKTILRSPEYSMSVMAQFFVAYSHPLESDTFRRMITHAINSAKSSNSIVRENAIKFYRAIVSTNCSDINLQLAAGELLSLPKSGKTTGPDHRITLYTMLRFTSPSPSASASIIQTTLPLLAKESHDIAASVLACAVLPHLVHSLRVPKTLPTDAATLIAKEMNNSKSPIRRAFCLLAGGALWENGDLSTEESLAFAKIVLPSFESNLKTVSSNPLNAIGGPLEGYIAVAVLLGPFSRSGKFDEIIRRNPTILSLTSSTSKPSFLLWDKVYQKVTDVEDETWLLRAIDVALQFFLNEISKNESFSAQIGLVLLHLAANSPSFEIRRNVNTVVAASTTRAPELANRVIREALMVFLSQVKSKATTSPAGEHDTPRDRHARLSALLLSTVSFSNDLDLALREDLLVELVVIAHHHLICGTSRQTWIDMCQKAHADPHDLVDRHLDKLFKLILAASTASQFGFAEAGYTAVTTLAFVSPVVVLPRVVEQLKADIDPNAVNALTELDFGVIATPEGSTFVDVLSSTKGEINVKKGKDAEIAKWEAELRKSLANKKISAPVSLTKQQQALVQAQLEKESEIRRHVISLKAKLERGLWLVRSLVVANVLEFRSYVSSIASLLLDGALGQGSQLVGRNAFETYLELARSCSERLESFRTWTGIATLRSLKPDAVPQEFHAEPLNLLVIRVLYRLRFFSEQATFDAATFSYAFPLIGQVLTQGGVDTETEGDALEQITLALDIIKFHCGEFWDIAFPRAKTMEQLLCVIKQQPKLGKMASSTLIDIGEAIHNSATREELDVLLCGTLLQEAYVRNSCLQTLQPFDLTDLDWSPELWIACHDEDEQNARLARHLWEDNGLDVSDSFLEQMLDFLGHDNAYVRSSTAAAIAEAVEYWPQAARQTIVRLQDYYCDKAKVLAPEFDEYGMVITQSLGRSDPWPARLSAARTFELLSPYFPEGEVEPFFRFLIQDEALGDREPDVRRGMLAAGNAVIDLHGSSRLTGLISMFEEHLGRPSPATETGDHIKEAVVILFGRVARHLASTDPRIPVIVDRLVEALKTPAEQVQVAVSDCLSPLAKIMGPKLPKLVDHLFDELRNSPKYAARRGAAYGLAGVLKGTGIAGFREFDVISRLRTAAEDKKRYEPRQGAMFAFETLSHNLGRLFEPYITYVLPLLLTSFGDGTSDVREATQDAARVIMGNMSGYGVKLILPSLLSGLEEKQWRTKKGSIELLGMMAYCSPRQLSLSLPIVIPPLTDVLTDSHAQVRAAANKSLKQFGEVISNPEIQSLVPVLLKALADPAKTPSALSSLLKTSFVHYIDHSSLALVIPILERGLRERGADTKKKAAQIVGNLASLTDSKDFVPYLSELLPMVHLVLVDPVPEARATAAKALGTLVERLGEVHFPDLVPGLLRTLKTDTSGIDRQGAAQGLSEVLSGLGMERLEGLLPDIIANAQSPRATVREGFMSLLVFLPATFGTRFQPHLPKIVPPILGGLSDTEEYVREAAMRAGRMVVTNYSGKAIDLLLPELEQGMFDPGWRIRQSSITLVGELLFKVSGISGKTSEIEEDEAGADAPTAESSRRALTEVLGVERRDRILSALYLVRQDSVLVVRQSSILIWKALVSNTPRTVREILPELLNQIVFLISSSEFEQQEIAARTTAELCRKFGERILGAIMPILRTKSASSDPRTREGVCLTLCEIMISSTDGQREGHEDDIISMVRVSLVDDEANVRSAAAKAFDMLQEHIGAKAVDQTIPTLLEALRQPGKSSGTALQALREVMSVRASTVFPVLIPTLTAIPMTAFNARALASLVSVAGNALNRRLTVIVYSLVKVLEDETDEELRLAVDEAIRALFASISDPEGLNTLMMILMGWAKHDSPNRRVGAYKLFTIFCEESKLDYSLYRVDWVRQLTSALEDPQVPVHTTAWHAFDVFVKAIPKDELEPLVVALRRSIESTGSPGSIVPGFSLPKGVSPMVPIIIAGLTTGSNEQREQAAYAIGDLVERTEENAIKPFVVPFTGPLIRVATQATTYPPPVKAAILSALTSMLERIPVFVKPFFPQLQRTFIKSAGDPASAVVRTKAAHALGVLMKSQLRVDPVVTELITGARGNEDSVSSSLVLALANVVRSASENVGEKAREACVELVSDAFRENHDEYYTQSIAALISALTPFAELLRPVVEGHLIGGTTATILSSQTILAVLDLDAGPEGGDGSPNLFQRLGLMRSVAQKVQESVACEKPSVARPAREARELLKAADDPSLQGFY